MTVTNDIKYIGVNDHEIDLFEGQYIVPNGMAYNSYVIMDEEIAVMDTVDQNFTDEWFAKLERSCRPDTGLHRSSAYGAGSFGEYREFHGEISDSNSCCKSGKHLT